MNLGGHNSVHNRAKISDTWIYLGSVEGVNPNILRLLKKNIKASDGCFLCPVCCHSSGKEKNWQWIVEAVIMRKETALTETSDEDVLL